MEKDQLQAERLSQLLDEIRRAFRARLDEVAALNEEDWDEAHLLEELNQALALLEDVRADYNKALAKIEAVHPQAASAAAAKPLVFAGASGIETGGGRGFGYWFRAGLAFTLPMMLVLAALALGWMGLYFFGP